MRKIISIQTDTATLVIYDLMSLKHRINDDVDWWSLPEDELEEIMGMYYLSILEMMVPIKSILKVMLMNIPGRYF